MDAGRVEAAEGGGWVLCIPLPAGEERLAFMQLETAEQGLALLNLHSALQMDDAEEVQRLVDLVQADDESLADMREMSVIELVQMMRLSLEEGPADNVEQQQPASGNNATPSPHAHGTMISMDSTAAGAQSPQGNAAAPMLAVKQEQAQNVKVEQGQDSQPVACGWKVAVAAAPAAVVEAPAAVDGPVYLKQLDEQPWDGMEIDDAAGSDYPGVSRAPPSASGSGLPHGWQVALLVRLDAAGSPAADAEPSEELFNTATELEAALASDLAQLWQEQHCGPPSFGAFGRRDHFNQSWFNHSVTSYSLDAPLWSALAQLSTFSEFQAYLAQLQAHGFLTVAAQTYSDLQLPPEPWPDPQLASGLGSLAQPSSSPTGGAGGGSNKPADGRMHKGAWQPVGAQLTADEQQPTGQPPAMQQQQGEQQQQQEPAGRQQQPQQGAPGSQQRAASPQGPGPADDVHTKGSISDEQLARALTGLSYLQRTRKWRAFLVLPPPLGSGKQLYLLADDAPMMAALARDLAVFWRMNVLKRPSAKMPPAVLHASYTADAKLRRRLAAVGSIEELRSLLRSLRDEGTLGQLVPALRRCLLQQRKQAEQELEEEEDEQQQQAAEPPQQHEQQQPKAPQQQSLPSGLPPPPLLQQQQPSGPETAPQSLPSLPQKQLPEAPARPLGRQPEETEAQHPQRQGSLQRKRDAAEARLDCA